MRCNHCDRVIEKDESFYEINREVYCCDCITKHEITYYEIGNDGQLTHTDEDTIIYNDKNEYILSLKARLIILEDEKQKYENIKNPQPWQISHLKYTIKKIEETKKLLEKIQVSEVENDC